MVVNSASASALGGSGDGCGDGDEAASDAVQASAADLLGLGGRAGLNSVALPEGLVELRGVVAVGQQGGKGRGLVAAEVRRARGD